MISRNQLGVVYNPYQGVHKKVLTVCSAGCLRSPTAAHILSSDPWNFNTRCAGVSQEYAIIPITEALILWADVIVCMDAIHARVVNEMQNELATQNDNYEYKQVIVLDIPDNFAYRDPELVSIMKEKFKEIFSETDKVVG